RYLGGEWAGHGLAKGHPVQELGAIQPVSLFDKVTLHVAHGGDRPAEPERPEPEEVPQEPTEGHSMAAWGAVGRFSRNARIRIASGPGVVGTGVLRRSVVRHTEEPTCSWHHRSSASYIGV